MHTQKQQQTQVRQYKEAAMYSAPLAFKAMQRKQIFEAVMRQRVQCLPGDPGSPLVIEVEAVTPYVPAPDECAIPAPSLAPSVLDISEIPTIPLDWQSPPLTSVPVDAMHTQLIAVHRSQL